MRVEIESRHSDTGPDAGSYRVLRVDGVWVGRADNRPAADKLVNYVEAVEMSVRVWRFESAPDEYKKQSSHGGGETWLALVPAVLRDDALPDMLAKFAMSGTQVVPQPNGDWVLIG